MAIAFIAGFFVGSAVTKKRLAPKISELEAVVNAVYPPSVGEVKAVDGIITAIQGDTIELDIPSLTKRYAKPGDPLPRQTVTIVITPETKITELLLDPKAKPKTITKTALAAGDAVYVTIAEDLKTTERATALTIQKNVYPTSTIGR
ncbi:MAG: hypothetical protein Q7R73_00160 [bacterium]|nr:hypothetical protein [bacterium]